VKRSRKSCGIRSEAAARLRSSVPEARRKGKKTEENGKTRILELCPRTAVVTGCNRSFFAKV
jgi:hypothetical protein